MKVMKILDKLIEPIPLFHSYGKTYIDNEEFESKENNIICPLIGIHYFRCEGYFLIFTPNEKYNEKQFDSYDLAMKYLLKSLKEL